MSESVLFRVKSILDTHGPRYAESPLPATIASAAILTQLPSSKRLYNARVLPRPWAVLAFSALFAVGGWMKFDGAKVDGARATAAWSAAYVFANGSVRKVARLARMGRVAPVGIVALAATNVVVDGYYGVTAAREEGNV